MSKKYDRDGWVWRDIVDRDNPICSFSPANVDDLEIDTDVKTRYVASFNWKYPRHHGGRPYMIVPGCPLKYSTWKGGKLERTKGLMFVDQNHAMNKKFPMESLFRCVQICSSMSGKDLKFQDYDFCTDRNNLRKIYSIASSTRSNGDGPCRIDIERVGNLIALIRVERTDVSKDHYGNFGHSFEHVMTRPVPGAGHGHRPGDGSFRCVKEVKFAGFKLLVRFEVDCADYGDDFSSEDFQTIGNGIANATYPKQIPGSILGCVVTPSLFLDNGEKKSIPVEKTKSLVELTSSKTGSVGKKWPQLYFSGTDRLVIGRHNDGLFDRIDELSLEKVEQRIGGRPKHHLKKMATLLEAISNFCREMPEGQLCSLVWHPKLGDRDQIFMFQRHSNAFTRIAPSDVIEQLRI